MQKKFPAVSPSRNFLFLSLSDLFLFIFNSHVNFDIANDFFQERKELCAHIHTRTRACAHHDKGEIFLWEGTPARVTLGAQCSKSLGGSRNARPVNYVLCSCRKDRVQVQRSAEIMTAYPGR